MTRTYLIIASLASLLFLAACGGGAPSLNGYLAPEGKREVSVDDSVGGGSVDDLGGSGANLDDGTIKLSQEGNSGDNSVDDKQPVLAGVNPDVGTGREANLNSFAADSDGEVKGANHITVNPPSFLTTVEMRAYTICMNNPSFAGTRLCAGIRITVCGTRAAPVTENLFDPLCNTNTRYDDARLASCTTADGSLNSLADGCVDRIHGSETGLVNTARYVACQAIANGTHAPTTTHANCNTVTDLVGCVDDPFGDFCKSRGDITDLIANFCGTRTRNNRGCEEVVLGNVGVTGRYWADDRVRDGTGAADIEGFRTIHTSEIVAPDATTRVSRYVRGLTSVNLATTTGTKRDSLTLNDSSIGGGGTEDGVGFITNTDGANTDTYAGIFTGASLSGNVVPSASGTATWRGRLNILVGNADVQTVTGEDFQLTVDYNNSTIRTTSAVMLDGGKTFEITSGGYTAQRIIWGVTDYDGSAGTVSGLIGSVGQGHRNSRAIGAFIGDATSAIAYAGGFVARPAITGDIGPGEASADDLVANYVTGTTGRVLDLGVTVANADTFTLNLDDNGNDDDDPGYAYASADFSGSHKVYVGLLASTTAETLGGVPTEAVTAQKLTATYDGRINGLAILRADSSVIESFERSGFALRLDYNSNSGVTRFTSAPLRIAFGASSNEALRGTQTFRLNGSYDANSGLISSGTFSTDFVHVDTSANNGQFTGDLRGIIGADGAVGVFRTRGTNAIEFVGGFDTTPTPAAHFRTWLANAPAGVRIFAPGDVATATGTMDRAHLIQGTEQSGIDNVAPARETVLRFSRLFTDTDVVAVGTGGAASTQNIVVDAHDFTGLLSNTNVGPVLENGDYNGTWRGYLVLHSVIKNTQNPANRLGGITPGRFSSNPNPVPAGFAFQVTYAEGAQSNFAIGNFANNTFTLGDIRTNDYTLRLENGTINNTTGVMFANVYYQRIGMDDTGTAHGEDVATLHGVLGTRGAAAAFTGNSLANGVFDGVRHFVGSFIAAKFLTPDVNYPLWDVGLTSRADFLAEVAKTTQASDTYFVANPSDLDDNDSQQRTLNLSGPLGLRGATGTGVVRYGREREPLADPVGNNDNNWQYYAGLADTASVGEVLLADESNKPAGGVWTGKIGLISTSPLENNRLEGGDVTFTIDYNAREFATNAVGGGRGKATIGFSATWDLGTGVLTADDVSFNADRSEEGVISGTGELRGLIGTGGAIGTFKNTSGALFVGGFIAHPLVAGPTPPVDADYAKWAASFKPADSVAGTPAGVNNAQQTGGLLNGTGTGVGTLASILSDTSLSSSGSHYIIAPETGQPDGVRTGANNEFKRHFRLAAVDSSGALNTTGGLVFGYSYGRGFANQYYAGLAGSADAGTALRTAPTVTWTGRVGVIGTKPSGSSSTVNVSSANITLNVDYTDASSGRISLAGDDNTTPTTISGRNSATETTYKAIGSGQLSFNGDWDENGVISGQSALAFSNGRGGLITVAGTLNGLIGSLRAIGVFKSTETRNDEYAGGFIAENPDAPPLSCDDVPFQATDCTAKQKAAACLADYTAHDDCANDATPVGAEFKNACAADPYDITGARVGCASINGLPDLQAAWCRVPGNNDNGCTDIVTATGYDVWVAAATKTNGAVAADPVANFFRDGTIDNRLTLGVNVGQANDDASFTLNSNNIDGFTYASATIEGVNKLYVGLLTSTTNLGGAISATARYNLTLRGLALTDATTFAPVVGDDLIMNVDFTGTPTLALDADSSIMVGTTAYALTFGGGYDAGSGLITGGTLSLTSDGGTTSSTGDLTGLIGADGAVGVFRTTDTAANAIELVGGFTGTDAGEPPVEYAAWFASFEVGGVNRDPDIDTSIPFLDTTVAQGAISDPHKTPLAEDGLGNISSSVAQTSYYFEGPKTGDTVTGLLTRFGNNYYSFTRLSPAVGMGNENTEGGIVYGRNAYSAAPYGSFYYAGLTKGANAGPKIDSNSLNGIWTGKIGFTGGTTNGGIAPPVNVTGQDVRIRVSYTGADATNQGDITLTTLMDGNDVNVKIVKQDNDRRIKGGDDGTTYATIGGQQLSFVGTWNDKGVISGDSVLKRGNNLIFGDLSGIIGQNTAFGVFKSRNATSRSSSTGRTYRNNPFAGGFYANAPEPTTPIIDATCVADACANYADWVGSIPTPPAVPAALANNPSEHAFLANTMNNRVVENSDFSGQEHRLLRLDTLDLVVNTTETDPIAGVALLDTTAAFSLNSYLVGLTQGANVGAPITDKTKPLTRWEGRLAVFYGVETGGSRNILNTAIGFCVDFANSQFFIHNTISSNEPRDCNTNAGKQIRAATGDEQPRVLLVNPAGTAPHGRGQWDNNGVISMVPGHTLRFFNGNTDKGVAVSDVGSLSGIIGQDGVIGAFVGNSERGASIPKNYFAGGFVAKPNE